MMVNIFSYFFITIFLSSVVSQVEKISDTQLQELINAKKGLVVAFTIEFSGQVQRFLPLFEQAAAVVKGHHKIKELGEDIGAPKFYDIDLTNSGQGSEISKKYNIRTFPTILYLDFEDDHHTHHGFQGTMTVDTIVDFVIHYATPSIQPYPASADENLACSLYNYPSPDTRMEGLKSGYIKFAMKNRETTFFHHDHVQVGEDVRVEIIHKGQDKISRTLSEIGKEYEIENVNTDMNNAIVAVEKFYKDNTMPILGTIDQSTYNSYNGKPLIWILFNSDNYGDYMGKLEKVRPFANSLRNSTIHTSTELSLLAFHLGATPVYDFRPSIARMFNLNVISSHIIAQRQMGLPGYWIYPDPPSQNPESPKSPLSELIFNPNPTYADMTPILDWLSKVSKNEIPRNMKSEPIPDYDTEPGEPKVIVASNMVEKVFNPTKTHDTFIHIFAPWCGFSKKFMPEFRRVARKIHNIQLDNDIMLAAVDGTQNESPVDELSWSAYPTIAFVKGDTKKVIYYNEGDRSAEKVYKWVLEHSTYKAKMDTDLGDENIKKVDL